MKELYLMRHGQTLFNQLHRIQGSCDSPLTAQGIASAQKVGLYFKKQGIVFDHAYASTQERACDTLECITKQPYERLKGIKEWNFGVFEGQSEQLNPKVDPTSSYGDFFVQFGGESNIQVQQRMAQTLDGIMAKPDHQRVLAVSHAGAIFMFLRKYADPDTVKKLMHKFKNCDIFKFAYEDHQFNFVELINPEKD